MIYTLTKNNLHIEDSYLISKHDMKSILLSIKYADSQNCDVWKRSIKSLISEWVTHNFLYKLGLWKDRTKDADLNYPCDKPEFIYIIIGGIVWIFIK